MWYANSEYNKFFLNIDSNLKIHNNFDDRKIQDIYDLYSFKNDSIFDIIQNMEKSSSGWLTQKTIGLE